MALQAIQAKFLGSDSCSDIAMRDAICFDKAKYLRDFFATPKHRKIMLVQTDPETTHIRKMDKSWTVPIKFGNLKNSATKDGHFLGYADCGASTPCIGTSFAKHHNLKILRVRKPFSVTSAGNSIVLKYSMVKSIRLDTSFTCLKMTVLTY